MPDAGLVFDLVHDDGDWGTVAADARLDALAAAIYAREARAVGTAALVLSSDANVRGLNARFRGIDRPTNVLSFPSGEEPGPGAELGDIVLARETLGREAALDGKPLAHHFAHLVVHGTLHLLGHDHEDDPAADAMERLEAAILADTGVPDPYSEDHDTLPTHEPD